MTQSNTSNNYSKLRCFIIRNFLIVNHWGRVFFFTTSGAPIAIFMADCWFCAKSDLPTLFFAYPDFITIIHQAKETFKKEDSSQTEKIIHFYLVSQIKSSLLVCLYVEDGRFPWTSWAVRTTEWMIQDYKIALFHCSYCGKWACCSDMGTSPEVSMLNLHADDMLFVAVTRSVWLWGSDMQQGCEAQRAM